MARKEDTAQRYLQFALRYLANGHNATEGAQFAGYSAKTARVMGQKLLKRPAVQQLIAEHGAKALAAAARRTNRLELSAQRVLEETMRIAYGDVGQLFDEQGQPKPVQKLDEDTRRSISSIELAEVATPSNDRPQLDDGAPPPPPAMRIAKVKFWDKPRALEMLGKHLKLWTDVVEQRADGLTMEEKANRAAELIAGALARKLAAPVVEVRR